MLHRLRRSFERISPALFRLRHCPRRPRRYFNIWYPSLEPVRSQVRQDQGHAGDAARQRMSPIGQKKAHRPIIWRRWAWLEAPGVEPCRVLKPCSDADARFSRHSLGKGLHGVLPSLPLPSLLPPSFAAGFGQLMGNRRSSVRVRHRHAQLSPSPAPLHRTDGPPYCASILRRSRSSSIPSVPLLGWYSLKSASCVSSDGRNSEKSIIASWKRSSRPCCSTSLQSGPNWF